MRKIFVFIILSLAICFVGAYAQTFRVEKASKVKANGKNVTSGQMIDEKTTIRIDKNGYLMFVDTKSKKRYYINFSCKKKVKDLIKGAPAPVKVTKGYLESLITQNQDKDKYASAGSVSRGPIDDDYLLYEFALAYLTFGDATNDSVPERIGVDTLKTAEDTISVCIIQ